MDSIREMTDSSPELRCADCNGIFTDAMVFFLVGWAKPDSTTIVEEMEYDYDAGNLCKTCYSFRISQLKEKIIEFDIQNY